MSDTPKPRNPFEGRNPNTRRTQEETEALRQRIATKLDKGVSGNQISREEGIAPSYVSVVKARLKAAAKTLSGSTAADGGSAESVSTKDNTYVAEQSRVAIRAALHSVLENRKSTPEQILKATRQLERLDGVTNEDVTPPTKAPPPEEVRARHKMDELRYRRAKAVVDKGSIEGTVYSHMEDAVADMERYGYAAPSKENPTEGVVIMPPAEPAPKPLIITDIDPDK